MERSEEMKGVVELSLANVQKMQERQDAKKLYGDHTTESKPDTITIMSKADRE